MELLTWPKQMMLRVVVQMERGQRPVRTRDNQTKKDANVMVMITGIKRALTASAARCVGGFEACAS
jgi:hypothetical protein